MKNLRKIRSILIDSSILKGIVLATCWNWNDDGEDARLHLVIAELVRLIPGCLA